MRLLYAVAVFALFVSGAQAGEMHLLVNGKAIHLERQAGAEYNERNGGAGFQYDFGAGPWVPFVSASGFRDSNRNPSYYAGGGALRRVAMAGGLHVDIGAIAFVMWREGYRDGEPFLGVLPAFSVGGPRAALNMTYIPAVDPKMVPLVFLQLKVRLSDP